MQQRFYLLIAISLISFMLPGCISGRSFTTAFLPLDNWNDKIKGKSAVDHDVVNYARTHLELSEEIQTALQQRRVVRGMNKEQVLILLGKPQKVLSKGEGAEIWWYHVRIPPLWYFLEPDTWLYFLFYPSDRQRDEVHWKRDRVQDLEIYKIFKY